MRALHIAVAAVVAAVPSVTFADDRDVLKLTVHETIKASPLMKENCLISRDKETGVMYCSLVHNIPGVGQVFTRCAVQVPFDGSQCQTGRVPASLERLTATEK